MITKYGTFIVYQHKVTKEIVELDLTDDAGIKKFAEDPEWEKIEYIDDVPTTENTEEE